MHQAVLHQVSPLPGSVHALMYYIYIYIYYFFFADDINWADPVFGTLFTKNNIMVVAVTDVGAAKAV